MMKKENPIMEKSYAFALKIVELSTILEEQKHFAIANQIIRSGTSVGANVWEAQNAESKADFLHKMKISAKEAEETEFWLLICRDSEKYPDTSDMILLIKEIQKILTKIIVNCRNN